MNDWQQDLGKKWDESNDVNRPFDLYSLKPKAQKFVRKIEKLVSDGYLRRASDELDKQRDPSDRNFWKNPVFKYCNKLIDDTEEKSKEERQLVVAKKLKEQQLKRDREQQELTRKKQQNEKKRKEDIAKIIEERGIEHLVHFTEIDNLVSILNNGILSRTRLDKENYDYRYTDDVRMDGLPDWISTSVSFPNSAMFFKKRKNNETASGWVVIMISSSVLLELDTMFMYTNAANSEIKYKDNDLLSSEKAFSAMFTEKDRQSYIPNNYTTDLQAEIMIKGAIPAKYIDRLIFKNENDESPIINDIPRNTAYKDPSLFAPRDDYMHWSDRRHLSLSSKEIDPDYKSH